MILRKWYKWVLQSLLGFGMLPLRSINTSVLSQKKLKNFIFFRLTKPPKAFKVVVSEMMKADKFKAFHMHLAALCFLKDNETDGDICHLK